jgi:hypothetical protein
MCTFNFIDTAYNTMFGFIKMMIMIMIMMMIMILMMMMIIIIIIIRRAETN